MSFFVWKWTKMVSRCLLAVCLQVRRGKEQVRFTILEGMEGYGKR